MPKAAVPIVSLFCGPGGMDLGFEKAGFAPIFACDLSPSAVSTYNANRRSKVAAVVDLLKTKNEEIISLIESAAPGCSPRGVIGGPPCQAFSNGNVSKKKRDPRKKLLLRYARILKALNHRFDLDFFVFENVTGLSSPRHRSYFSKIRRELAAAGFALFEAKLCAEDYGVPQYRRRVFIVGLNEKRFPLATFVFPKGIQHEPKTVKDAIGDLPRPAYYERDLKKKEIPYHVNHWTMRPRSAKFRNRRKSIGRSFRRLQWNRPSWTVAYGHRELHVHPSGSRRVSIFEAMLLQTFPKRYRLAGTLSEQVTQISNAVPPLVAYHVALAVRHFLYDRPAQIRKLLLAWHCKSARNFPWRQTRDPYKILLAEKLLQQTAATPRVVAIYNSLTARYTTPRELSEADPDLLRTELASLGLHYRSAELIALAKCLVRRYGGRVPSELERLLELPGVGDYSARATLCFAYGEKVPIVDTNVARLLTRLEGAALRSSNPARNSAIRKAALRLLPEKEARRFNFAVLDFCAAICTASKPKCDICPLKAECLSIPNNHGLKQTSLAPGR